jgi:DNA-binding XRE family transcriptional regulator
MSEQVIYNKKGKPEFAVVPYGEYERLKAAAEMVRDVAAFDEAVNAAEDVLPEKMVRRLTKGENPIRVWREYRGLVQPELAESVGISAAYLSQIESGARQGSIEVLRALANGLRVSLDDIT